MKTRPPDHGLMATMPIGRREVVFQAGVYSFLVRQCLNLLESTAQAVCRAWGIDDDDLDVLVIRSCPSEVENLIASQACAAKFGGDLSGVDGFYQFNDVWRLDLNQGLRRTGVLLPVRNRFGWFTQIKVFRHAKDQNPFALKVRAKREAAA